MTIGGYRVEAVVGHGGMGVVCRAIQVALARRVALKVIAPRLGADPRFRDRFRHECQLAASLDHPHIVPIHEAGEDGGLLFVSMRWIEGVDLRCLIDNEGPLEPRRALAIVAQVASALDMAHAAGLVHRDVKPANVLVERRDGAEHAWLGDFGLVKRLGADPRLTGSDGWLGTVDYVAPEQVRGETVGAPADVFALAATLYTALSGEVPFARADTAAKLYACVNDPVPALGAVRPDLAGLDGVLAWGLAKDPAHRYPSAGHLVAAADAALAAPAAPPAAGDWGGPLPVSDARSTGTDGAPPCPGPGAGYGAPPASRPRRRRSWAVAAALVAVTVLVGGIVALSGGGGRRPAAPVAAHHARGPQAGPSPTPAPQPAAGVVSLAGSHASRTFDMVTDPADSSILSHFRVTVYDLRRSGPYLTLDLGIACRSAIDGNGSKGPSSSCDSEESFAYATGADRVPVALGAGKTAGTIGGIRLVDPAHAKEYEVVRDAKGEPFGSQLDFSTEVGPTVHQAWAKYAAPPPSVTSMDLLLPQGGPAVLDVPVTTGGPTSLGAGVSGASPATFDRPPGSTDPSGLILPMNDIVAASGNPQAYASQAAQQTTVTLNADVLFDFGQAGLTPAAQGILSAQAARIKSGARGAIAVTGYTDSIGPDSVNLPLSQARAQAVVAGLTPEVAGAPVTFQATGLGAADPVAANSKKDGSDDPQGRALNRRVTLTYTAAGTPAPPAPVPAPAAASSGPRTVAYHYADGIARSDYTVTADSLVRSGRYLLADLTMTCSSSENGSYCDSDGNHFGATVASTVPPVPGQDPSAGGEPRDVDGLGAIYLTDSGGTLYDVGRTTQASAATAVNASLPLTADTPLSSWTVVTAVRLWLLFPAPPASATSATIDMPGDAAEIRGVPISG